MPTSFRTSISMSVLLLVATPAWAGPGDIDAGFGTSGRLELMNEVSLVLPDDRLVVAYNAGNLIVARLDANGQVDPTFGNGGPTFADGGETRVPLPGAWPRFYAYYASATPDGGLLFAGPLRDFGQDLFVEAVLRLDRDGHLVTSFGGHGDGYFRLTDAPVDSSGLLPTRLMAIAVDANGRILLALRSWTADGRCNGPTRVMRLTSSGRPDAAFGANGHAEVPGVDLCDGAALFGVRKDGSVVVGAHGSIVGLDSSGALDPVFGEGGHVSRELSRGFLLPDDGVLIVQADSSTTASDATFTKLDRSGRPDLLFGAGTGSVQLDFRATFFGLSGSHQSVHDFVLAPDAAHMYLKLSVQHLDGTTACVAGIARLSLDGTPDNSFGRHGLTCLDYGAFTFSLVAAQRNGSPLFGTQYGLYRLLLDATPSPGMLTIVRNGSLNFGEDAGTVTVPVAVRTAGRDGAVSVSFSTGPRHLNLDDGSGPPSATDATPGSDFESASGRLDWADGDESERAVTVTILDDTVGEFDNERFSIGISEPQGGALGPEYDTFTLGYPASVDVGIVDDDEAAEPTSPPPTSLGSSSGGGSLSWTTLFVVAALLLGRGHRWRRRRLAASLSRIRGLSRIERPAHWRRAAFSGRGRLDQQFSDSSAFLHARRGRLRDKWPIPEVGTRRGASSQRRSSFEWTGCEG